MDHARASSSASPWLTLTIAILAIYVLAVVAERVIFRVGKDEPPQVFSRVPFVGHTIGMILYGSGNYWRQLYKKNPLPIFTVNMFGTHLYIAATPAFTTQIQRASKTLSFGAIAMELIGRMNLLGSDVMDVVKEQKTVTTSQVPQGSYVSKLLNLEEKAHEMQNPMLGPGSEALEDLSVVQMSKMAEMLNELPANGKQTELFAFLRHIVTISNTEAVYGPDNIITRDPEMETAFWKYENNLHLLILGPVGHMMAPGAVAAVKKLKQALADWETSGGYTGASTWIKARYHLSIDHGVTPHDTASFDMSLMFGVLANAMPSTFWLICYLYSNLSILEQLRTQLVSPDVVLQSNGPGKAQRTYTISLGGLRDKAPLMAAVFKETLRIVSPAVSARVVKKDTLVSGADNQTYLLKKGGICQIPGSVLHFDKGIWGPDADLWNPQRDSQGVHPAAFRSFGGGVSLCPGRHFASMEITGFAAAIVLGFNIKRADGQAFFVPKQKNDVVPLSVGKPVDQVPVVIAKRYGYEDVIWQFSK